MNPRMNLPRRWVRFCLLGLVALMLGWVFFAQRAIWKEAARESDCIGQLRQYGLAFHNYHDIYGSFPPAITVDPDGDPIHSWRTVLLAAWEDNLASKEYDRAVSWNHPKNRPALVFDTQAFFYWCPSGDGRKTKMTDYVAVVGPRTAWPEGRGRKLSEITDGRENTILVIEVMNSGIHWTEPRDMTLDEVLTRGVSSPHPGHFNAMFADGLVHKIRKDIDREALKALLTVDGAETVDPRSWKVR